MIVVILTLIIALLGGVIVPISLALFHYWKENKNNIIAVEEKKKELKIRIKAIEQKDKEISLLETQIIQKDKELEIEKQRIQAMKQSLSEMNLTEKQKNEVVRNYTNHLIETSEEAKKKGVLDIAIDQFKHKAGKRIADGVYNWFFGE